MKDCGDVKEASRSLEDSFKAKTAHEETCLGAEAPPATPGNNSGKEHRPFKEHWLPRTFPNPFKDLVINQQGPDKGSIGYHSPIHEHFYR